LRARNLLEDAARSGGVAHFWIHPENIATHRSTLANFAAIVEEMARARRDGRVEIRTQIAYCDLVQAGRAR
jgi:hypothetical protein